MDREEAYFGRALGRLTRWMLLLAAGGALTGWLAAGWRWVAGFLLGAAVSGLNFRWLKQVVEALGAGAEVRRRPKARLAVFLGLRYGLLGLATYVIFITSALRVPAFLTGLFVPVAAVVAEILFELVYARD